MEYSTNRLLDVWATLLSFSKNLLSNTFSLNIDNWSVAFSLLFSIYYQRWLYRGILLTERFPRFGCEGNNQRESVCVVDAESLS